MQHNYPAPNYDGKQLCHRCSRFTHDALWLFIMIYHLYVILSGINPFGIL